MIFGDVYVDVIQTNEHTLWSGGPGEDPSYNGGHLRTPEVNKDYLHKARVMLQQKMNDFTANRSAYIDENGKLITHNYDGDGDGTELRNLIDNLAGTKEHFGSFQTLSNIIVETVNPGIPVLIKEAVQTNYDNTKNQSQSIGSLFRALPANGLPITTGSLALEACHALSSGHIPMLPRLFPIA